MASNFTAAQSARLMAASNSILGRYQGPELFHSQAVDLSAPSTVIPTRALNLNRPLESLTILLRFRVAVTVANYAAVAPEAPQNILQEIQLSGTHRAFGNMVPIRMSGATAFIWPRLFQSQGNDLIINGSRMSDAGRPFTSPFLGTTAGSPYDVAIFYHLPLGPMMGIGQLEKLNLINFLYLPADWGDSLQLTLRFGDKSAFGDPTGATVALTGFGSGTGLPEVQIHANYSLLGQFAQIIDRNGVVIRSENTVNTLTSLLTNTMLQSLQKQVTTNVVIKSGVLETTGQTAGVSTLESVSDLILDRTQIVADNKPVRNVHYNLVQKDYMGRMFNTVIPQGYLVQSFVEGQNPLLAYRGDGLQGGSQFEMRTDVIAANANTRVLVTQETVSGGPFPALR
jgi:hypothetical protein